MSDDPLAFASIDELWSAIASRCDCAILAFELSEDTTSHTTTTRQLYVGGTSEAIGLASKIRHNLLRSCETEIEDDNEDG